MNHCLSAREYRVGVDMVGLPIGCDGDVDDGGDGDGDDGDDGG